MTIYCIACKKEPLPGNNSRSFHKFPDDPVLKQQWLTAIGKCSATKYTKLCSDHFDNNAFVDCGRYIKKRRLLPNAVPCKLVNTKKGLSDTAVVSSNVVTKYHTKINSQNVQCTSSDSVENTGNLYFSSDNNLPTNITNNCIDENKQKCCESASRSIYHSSVTVNLASEDSVIESTKDLSTQLFSEQATFNEPTSIDDHKNLKRTSPLRDITDVSPNKRLHSHDECDSTVVKKVCKEPQPNTMHVNLKRSSPGVDKSDASPSGKLCFSNQFDSSGKDASVSVEPKKDQAALKRSRPSSIDVSNIPSSKKIRFHDGSQPMQLSREDFTSHEAWTRFLKFYVCKKRQIQSGRRKDARKSRTIENIKELVTKLREHNATATADYLQELPAHVKQLISRMKNHQPTSPFPAHLKTFARTLHFHSPAAYEIVRKSFFKCLPCVETLNR